MAVWRASGAGLDYNVSVEAVSGQSLQYHYNNKLGQIGQQSWDDVVMHDDSTLNAAHPGDRANLDTYSKLIEQYIHADSTNANANVFLMETWARADQVYNTPGGHWNGTSIEKMGGDLQDAYAEAAAQDTKIPGVIPVGDAFLSAVHSGVADANPYDAVSPAGAIDLWNVDSYHASAWGSYLEALTIYGQITGLDPRAFGAAEQVASIFGITADQAGLCRTSPSISCKWLRCRNPRPMRSCSADWPGWLVHAEALCLGTPAGVKTR